MEIKTKYKVGDVVYYFDTTIFRLRRVFITTVEIYTDYYNTTIKYMIDLHNVCVSDGSCAIVDDINMWFAQSTDTKVETLVIEEKFLFSTLDEFVNYVTPISTKIIERVSVYREPIPKF